MSHKRLPHLRLLQFPNPHARIRRHRNPIRLVHRDIALPHPPSVPRQFPKQLVLVFLLVQFPHFARFVAAARAEEGAVGREFAVEDVLVGVGGLYFLLGDVVFAVCAGPDVATALGSAGDDFGGAGTDA